MNRGFDQEFYSSEWRRVLPLGPEGIQPYVRTARLSRRPGLRAALARLIATWGEAAWGAIRSDALPQAAWPARRCE